jgi:hypothetical protein
MGEVRQIFKLIILLLGYLSDAPYYYVLLDFLSGVALGLLGLRYSCWWLTNTCHIYDL